ncbi:MAG: ankyrin repeat domain-containing protein [Longimicrobiales bacterium]
MAPLLLAFWLSAVPLESPVADAAMRGDAVEVEALIQQGLDVNAPQGDGMTALHWAAESGRVEIADLLLTAGAATNGLTRNGGYTPLHLAARNGRTSVVESLLEAGADATAATSSGNSTPLHLAAAIGDVQSVVLLLDHSAEVDVRESEWGQTPLMFAAGYGRTETVRTLLAQGADPSVATLVIDIPARAGVDDAAGAVRDSVLDDFRTKYADGDLNWRPTPEQVRAAVRAAQKVQRTLADAEEDEEEIDPQSEAFPGYTGLVGTQGGLTALLHAVREGHVQTAIALIEGGADVNQVSAGDHTSPMLLAAINGHFDLALLLLERGADPSVPSAAGATPLFAALNTHWAPKARYPQQQAYHHQDATYLDVMTAMLEAGADPNARLEKHIWYMSYTFDLLRVNVAGATAFWRAAYATDVEAVKLLVAHGADPNVPTVKPPERRRRSAGPTAEDPSGLAPVPVGGPAVWPIHAASGVGYGEGFAGNSHRHAPNGWLPTVKYLLEELGADVNARDHNGYNAVHHAAARGDTELIRYLVAQGADVMAVSRSGQTTIDMANGPFQRIQPFPETIAYLESLGAVNNHNCVSC